MIHRRPPCFAAALTLCLVLRVAAPPARAAAPEGLARTVAALDRARILRLAEAALTLAPPAITAHPARLSKGGPHDFFSTGDYWWPDPKKPGGLPYIKRDGETNPDGFYAHRQALFAMKDAVAALAAAWVLTGDEKYAAQAARCVRVFFLDEPTRMNPSLQYAQAIPGRSEGRGTGIIDTLHLAEVAMALRFLEKSPAFAGLNAPLKKWFADYTRWMLTSPNGLEELQSGNNHSVAFFVQVAAFARYTGDAPALELTRKRFREVLLPAQMSAEGSFPSELARTKPYGYSIFQLDNVATLAHLLSVPGGEDLWRFATPAGATPLTAVAFLFPYLADKAKWTAAGHPPDVMHWEAWPARQPALLFAYAETGERRYFELWQRLDADPADEEVRRNMAITQPLLWIADPAAAPLNK